MARRPPNFARRMKGAFQAAPFSFLMIASSVTAHRSRAARFSASKDGASDRPTLGVAGPERLSARWPGEQALARAHPAQCATQRDTSAVQAAVARAAIEGLRGGERAGAGDIPLFGNLDLRLANLPPEDVPKVVARMRELGVLKKPLRLSPPPVAMTAPPSTATAQQ